MKLLSDIQQLQIINLGLTQIQLITGLQGIFFSFMNSVAFNTLSDCLYTQME